MFRLYLIDCYDASIQFKDLHAISLENSGITSLELKCLLNEPYQLTAQINANFRYWETLKNNKNIGLRLETDFVNLAFIQDDRKQTLFGNQSFTFISSSHKLYESPTFNNNISYNGSLQTLLNGIDSNFVFTNISASADIDGLQTGHLNNLELVNSAINQIKAFSWRDNGIVDSGGGVFKTEILYGDFGNDIDTWYNANPTTRQNAASIEYLQTAFDNYLNENSAIPSYVNENDRGDYITYLKAVGDTGQGSAENATFVPNDPGATYIDPEYPLVPIVNPIKGTTEYYILNTSAPTYPVKYRTEIFTLSGNSEDSSGTQDINPTIAARRTYQLGVAFLKRTNRSTTISFNVTNKRIILPGNTAKITYKELIPYIGQRYPGVDQLVTYDVNEERTLNNLTFNLNMIQN